MEWQAEQDKGGPNRGVPSGASTDRGRLSSGRETPDLTVTGGTKGSNPPPSSRESSLSCDLYLHGSGTPAFRAGVPGCVPGAVGREPQDPPTSRQPEAISLSGDILVPTANSTAGAWKTCGSTDRLGAGLRREGIRDATRGPSAALDPFRTFCLVLAGWRQRSAPINRVRRLLKPHVPNSQLPVILLPSLLAFFGQHYPTSGSTHQKIAL